MDELVLLKEGIYETPDYVVSIGIIPGDKLPLYLVFHREHGVLEFTHNMIYFTIQAVKEMQEKHDEMTTENKQETLFDLMETPSGKAN